MPSCSALRKRGGALPDQRITLPGRAAERIPFVGMAAFRENEYQRLDYELLRSGPITSYFDRRVLAEDTRWLREHGYIVDAFDAGTWSAER